VARRVVIVQARMGSTRLPGKVMEHIAGCTVLRHVLARCRAIPGIDAVCCAVPRGSGDDGIATEAAACGALISRGSETDVLDRYAQAARETGAEVIMRVTSDCPVLDPQIAGQVLQLVTGHEADYACNNMPPSFPHGLDCEAMSNAWLQRAAQEARLPSEREHVTPYLRTHPQVVRKNLAGPAGAAVDYRWTLDTPDDLRFLRALFERLPPGEAGWDYRVPLAIIESNPLLATINAGCGRDAGRRRSAVDDATFLDAVFTKRATDSGGLR